MWSLKTGGLLTQDCCEEITFGVCKGGLLTQETFNVDTYKICHGVSFNVTLVSNILAQHILIGK